MHGTFCEKLAANMTNDRRQSMDGLRHPRLWVLGLLLGLAIAAPAAAEPLRLNSGVGAPYFLPDRRGFLDLLVPEVFRRIGVAAEATQYSASERAMINANNGIDDGVAMRIKLSRLLLSMARMRSK